jgi:DNA-binding MarR family transcriptional regulator/N-acetylglutamate synthase-like GNAT family acetyltransferase
MKQKENPMENLSETIQAIRHFNRFYTRQIGVLNQGLLDSPYSLTEARVIYELAQKETCTATELGSELNLDMGYLSRILTNFLKKGLLHKEPAARDKRQSLLRLSPAGQRAFAMLNQRSSQEINGMLSDLSAPEQGQLVKAMRNIEALLNPQPRERPAVVIRPLQPGDLGWVVSRHGALYAREYNWDIQFEGFVAQIAADYLKNLDPQKENGWIAEVNGENAGCVFLVRKSDEVAKLRMLLVEPGARGLGIGKRLVQECVRFARQCGYKRVTLWTQSCLLAARHIYQQAGFQLTGSEAYHDFGQDLVSETWDLDL